MWILFLLACASTLPTSNSARQLELEKVYDRYHFAFPKVRETSALEVKQRLSSGDPIVLIDVRPENERSVSIIPGAISLDEFNSHREDYRDKTAITYCTVGVRSGIEASKLRREGVEVENMQGSILGWTLLGGELVRPDGTPTKQVHVYGKRWNYAADGYSAVINNHDGTLRPL